MNGLALCSGSGMLEAGIHLVLPEQYRTVCAVEQQAYPAATFVDWLEKTGLGAPPVWDDVKTFDGEPWRGNVDIVTGGYPCQPFSNAGLRKGESDPRHLWPHIRRIVRSVQPSFCFSRMSQATLSGVSIPSKATFTMMVTELKRVCSRLHTLAHPIVESVFLSSRGWPTPTAAAAVQGQNNPDGKRGQTLIGAIRGQSWATPTVCGNNNAKGTSKKSGDGLQTQVKNWSTPKATRRGDCPSERKRKSPDLVSQINMFPDGHGRPVSEKALTDGKNRDQLNPAWVEQLMGWPSGLTQFTCSEMEWSRWLQQWRSWLFGVECTRSSNSVAA